ncbi:hypothetical protein AKUH4B412M_02290 [Apilactobacillus kunkeei]|nr:hypothetical protein AKUH4B412M_02290 [Apilactobacillus kunkeei]
MNNLDVGFEFLMKQNHVGIVYGVLKRLNIRVDNPQFDDLKQEGFIHLATKYSQYNDELDDDRICGYLFQAVYWHLLDILRKQQRTNDHVISVDTEVDGDGFYPHDEIDGINLLNQLWLHCTINQRKFLCCAYNESMTVTDIARKYHVSRKTVYQWKKGVQEEFYKLG